MSFDFVQTTAGITAFATAVANNTAVTVETAELGSGQFTPDGTETALMTPFAPVREFDPVRGAVSGEVLKFDFQDTGADAYDVGEVGALRRCRRAAVHRLAAGGGWLPVQQGRGCRLRIQLSSTRSPRPICPPSTSRARAMPLRSPTPRPTGSSGGSLSDTPTTNSRRYVTPTYMQDAIDDIPSATGDTSGITHVEASRVQQVGNEIRLTPSPAVTALTAGEAFRFRVEAATNGGVTVKVNALTASELRRRGNVQLGASAPQLVAGDLVTVVWISPRFWLVGIQPGTAALYDVGTSSGDIPVLGSGGDLAAGSIPNLPASKNHERDARRYGRFPESACGEILAVSDLHMRPIPTTPSAKPDVRLEYLAPATATSRRLWLYDVGALDEVAGVWTVGCG